MSDTTFKNDFEDLDDVADELGAKFQITPIADTPEEELAVERKVKAADEIAEHQGFQAPVKRRRKKTMRRSERLRTGRNDLLTAKTRTIEKETLSALTEDRKWVKGQTIQYALDALKEKINNPDDPFWETHNYYGVD